MIVKSQIKLIRSLHQKKYRNENGLFFVEGKKAVQELLNSRFDVVKVYSTEFGLLPASNEMVEMITEAELKKISALNTPNKVLGVFKIPKIEQVNFDDWIVAADDIRDPGNLGTIIRLCDWFGVKHLICSKETVDCYNPKTLQATMGSISRVNVGYTDLYEFLNTLEVPIYGAFMEGEVVYKNKLPRSGVLVMGNEANGISEKIESLINKKISIPQFGMQTTESLNVATATAILLNEIRRG
ncbi:RNA methyltransferase [Pseudozobellia sp. WGM2]|uniref:TrmH family RNA methyltransferase n=1 Tax=Pseudozobellia sp. WGM2 TaxID=2787625 RepID=UPI001AE06D69|nr:RNA methyltransferase [Pseudozobellia sp. WGM2]